MNFEVPKDVERSLQITEDFEGFQGVFPGHLHSPSIWESSASGFAFLGQVMFALVTMFVFLMESRYGHALSSSLEVSGGPNRHLERSQEVSFKLTAERLIVGDMSLPWTKIFFLRLVPPAIHSSYTTLQVFERHGGEHRWKLGADAYREIRWVVARMHDLEGSHVNRNVPDSLRQLLEEGPTQGRTA